MIICSLVRVLDNVKSSYLDEYIFECSKYSRFVLFYVFASLALPSQFSSLGCVVCFVLFFFWLFLLRLLVSHLVIFGLNFFP